MSIYLIPPVLSDVILPIRRGNTLKMVATLYNPDGTKFDFTGYHGKLVIKSGDDETSTTILTIADNDVNAYLTLLGAVDNNFSFEVPESVTSTLSRADNLYLELQMTNPVGEISTWWTGTSYVYGDLI
jgi:hypothetical protein